MNESELVIGHKEVGDRCFLRHTEIGDCVQFSDGRRAMILSVIRIYDKLGEVRERVEVLFTTGSVTLRHGHYVVHIIHMATFDKICLRQREGIRNRAEAFKI